MPFITDAAHATKEIVIAAIDKGYPFIGPVADNEERNKKFIDGIKLLIDEVYQSFISTGSKK